MPSGTLWAASNIGAETDAECGSHFAWGETETKETYDWANYKHCNGTYKTITKYNGWDYYGPTIDDKEILDAEYDVAQATWGENWQMPSQKNFLELLDTTLISREWVITPEFTGYIFTSKINGNQLRLPAAGYRFDKYMLDGFGLYWSKTRGGKYESSSAYSLHFEPDTVLNETTPRYYGCAIRPVAVDGYKPFHAVTYIKLSSNTVSLGMLQTKMVYATVNANAPIKDLTWVSSNPEVATVDNSGLITGVGFGTATITITANDGYGATATIQVVVEKKENETHGSVDLGLPSGTIWATCNVGAETDAERGDLYSWGEITGTKEGKTTFNWANYSLSKGTSSTITKYNSSKYYGDVDNLTELEDADDVAKAVWGKNWRMPSAAQIKELLDSTLTKQEYVSNSNFKGYVITSLINGKQIRIPTAGYKWSSTDGKDYDMTTYGAYWSRETGEYSVYAQSIKANSLEISLNQDTRAYGLSVRPVAEKDYTPYYYVTKITLPMEELTLEQDDKFIIKPQIDECATIKTLTWTISNPSIASIDENGIITAHGVGTTTLTVTSCDGGNVSATCKITVTPAHTLQPGEHDYVSLGLPSGTKWATCNIGANDYTEAGDFISWGETTGSQAGKTTFDVASYTLCNGSLTSMKKYIAESYYGTVDNLKKLESSDDAASVNWGADWCIPTATQVEELINPEYTTCEFTTLPNGFVGIVITSLINDKKLYLPIGGYRFSTYTMGTSYYWTSELENTIYAKILSFSRGGTPTMDKATRYYGATIRPVKK